MRHCHVYIRPASGGGGATVVYIVLGATHPDELRARGEVYRRGFEAVAREHKLENNVIFQNRLCGA